MHRMPCPRYRVAVFLLVGAGAFLSRGASAQDKAPSKPEIVVKRHTPTTEEDLRKQLKTVPEVGFDQPSASALYAIVTGNNRMDNPPVPNAGPKYLALRAIETDRPDLTMLPWLTGPDNELNQKKANDLLNLSIELQSLLEDSLGTTREKPAQLRKRFAGKAWAAPDAVPALTQVMQAEGTEFRLLMVEVLAKIRGKESSVALAQRAIFDLAPGVREKAIQELAKRPSAEYAPILMSGFRYPWPAIADHAAEAVAALQRTDLVPDLVKLLKEPDPVSPVKTERGYSVREIVSLNHLCNCTLCHSMSSHKTDRVRRAVPIPGEKLPVSYYEGSGISVKGDITYLRQDFSVVQPTAYPNSWPGQQRHDYLSRTRILTEKELTAFQKAQKEDRAPKSYPQQESVLFALRELTGKDYGSTHQEWETGLQNARVLPQAPQPRSRPQATAAPGAPNQ